MALVLKNLHSHVYSLLYDDEAFSTYSELRFGLYDSRNIGDKVWVCEIWMCGGCKMAEVKMTSFFMRKHGWE